MRLQASPLLVLLMVLVPEIEAQDLARQFQQARLVRIAQEITLQRGLFVELRPIAHLATRGDSLAAWMASKAPDFGLEIAPPPPPPPAPFQVDSVRVVSRLERVVFMNRYGRTQWAFMQGRRRAEIDTTVTADIRSRLQARFGPPTMTLAEMDSVRSRAAEEIIQFEYWMVINDSIPVMVLDVNGPLDRGVVVATDARFRPDLDAIRYALLQPLFDQPHRAPFVDYFYQTDTATWYASGFDGATFFHRRIERPNLQLGRPVLNAYVSPDQDR